MDTGACPFRKKGRPWPTSLSGFALLTVAFVVCQTTLARAGKSDFHSPFRLESRRLLVVFSLFSLTHHLSDFYAPATRSCGGCAVETRSFTLRCG